MVYGVRARVRVRMVVIPPNPATVRRSLPRHRMRTRKLCSELVAISAKCSVQNARRGQ